jgi:hypothetical protein
MPKIYEPGLSEAVPQYVLGRAKEASPGFASWHFYYPGPRNFIVSALPSRVPCHRKEAKESRGFEGTVDRTLTVNGYPLEDFVSAYTLEYQLASLDLERFLNTCQERGVSLFSIKFWGDASTMLSLSLLPGYPSPLLWDGLSSVINDSSLQ